MEILIVNMLWQSKPIPTVLERLDPEPRFDITFDNSFTGLSEWRTDPEGPLRILDWQWKKSCPEGLKYLANRYRAPFICGFTSIDETSNKGLMWHTDTYELFVVNTEGTTKWYFWDMDGEYSPETNPKNSSKWGRWPDKNSSSVRTIILEPLTTMFVPMWIPHTVDVLSEYRMSFSFVRYPSGMNKIMRKNNLKDKGDKPFDELNWPLY